MMKLLYGSIMILALTTANLAFATGNPSQIPNWKKNHPRRAQVLARDKKLNRRTKNAEKNGKITEGQAEKLEKEEGAIRKQEQADAAANGGHITKEEQRDLNREENKVNRQLRRDERKDRKRKGNAVPVQNSDQATGNADVNVKPEVNQ